MSKERPSHPGEVPFVPVNWVHRDEITGRLMEILEAVLPEGTQLTATKNIVKDMTKQYWTTLFNDQYRLLRDEDKIREQVGFGVEPYMDAIWQVARSQRPIKRGLV